MIIPESKLFLVTYLLRYIVIEILLLFSVMLKDAYERRRGNAIRGGKIGEGAEMRVPRVNSATSSVDLESSLFMY